MIEYITATDGASGMKYSIRVDDIHTIRDTDYDGSVLTLIDGQQIFLQEYVDDLFDENGQPKVSGK